MSKGNIVPCDDENMTKHIPAILATAAVKPIKLEAACVDDHAGMPKCPQPLKSNIAASFMKS